MFNRSFYSKVENMLSTLHDAETVSLAACGRCISHVKQCLADAEVDDDSIRQFTDMVLDCFTVNRVPSGRHLAVQVRSFLDEIPGLTGRLHRDRTWADQVPAARCAGDAPPSRWDMKELDNRLTGFNLASLGRLRKALGQCSERCLPGKVEMRRWRRFQACDSMQMTDRHDGRIDGEQINRLIRYLGWGEPGSDPHGGRPALLA